MHSLLLDSFIYQSLELDATYYPKDAANYGRDAILIKSAPDGKDSGLGLTKKKIRLMYCYETAAPV
jgi:hypothetical protein